jgi:hypothetical protein
MPVRRPFCELDLRQPADDRRITRQPPSKLLTLTLPHSRPKYTNIDLALTQRRCRPALTNSISVASYAGRDSGSNQANRSIALILTACRYAISATDPTPGGPSSSPFHVQAYGRSYCSHGNDSHPKIIVPSPALSYPACATRSQLLLYRAPVKSNWQPRCFHFSLPRSKTFHC